MSKKYDDDSIGFWPIVAFSAVAIFGLCSARREAKEEKRRKSTVFRFDDNITEKEFYIIVKHAGKGIRRLKDLYADGANVYGTVRSQSGINEWRFEIDFNDYGKLTGKYWLQSSNKDSQIPSIIAGKIADAIKEHE